MHVLIIPMILGLIPAYIANKKGHNFIEWWIFGSILLIVALPWSILMKADENLIAVEQGLKKCPRCAEWIKKEAKVCRYCNAKLEETLPEEPMPDKMKNYCPKCKREIDNDLIGECPDCGSFLITTKKKLIS